jgi:hypothetical protein
MKMRLSDILEALLVRDLPDGSSAHRFSQPLASGPTEFPYSFPGPTLDDEEIDKELQLEFGMGARLMQDPVNLSNHNIQHGAFAKGNSTQGINNYQLNDRDPEFDPSLVDASTKTFETESGESNKDIPDKWKKYFETKQRFNKEADEARPKRKEGLTLWNAAKAAKKEIKREEVGLRQKGLSYGSPVDSTKQPFYNGIPKATPNMDFYSDEEIDRELGLVESFSSSSIFNKNVHSATADLEFFERLAFSNSKGVSEEEFNKNQKLRGKNAKRKKERRSKRL